ncbi:hypothetical protein RDWZM_001635 [Blomia tropicalis]|uniref:Uncharacterized protein n=1 Tax=Blomia tropicalis TaxID=40697 RepID=A0A9Q0RQX5_BLOTA|nr:hypothetical protein BLOT_007841 [Blomia tropicalis]KAJ6223090.1 hypothetical protein RDWZM_001635 [Blomia tropicalis]
MTRFVFIVLFSLFAIAYSQPKPTTQSAAPVPTILWGTCPQLEPSETDKKSKAKILADCLKDFPIPEKVTEQTIAQHQKSIAECALKKENWFESDGSYKFSKAESEIKKKKLDSKMEAELLAAHSKCKGEAKEMFKTPKVAGGNNVEQVQFFQSCMDFHITKSCNIKIQQPAVSAS